MLFKYFLVLLLSLSSTSVVLAAGEFGSSGSNKSENYRKAVEAIEAEKFKNAIVLLKKEVGERPKDADAWNYLGFSYRKINEFDQAFVAYRKALKLKPKHRGANEYIGELYLQIDDLEKAKMHLEVLDDACFFGCDEYDDLKAAINAYENQ